MLNKCNKCSSPYQTKYSYTLSSYDSSTVNQRNVSVVLLDDQILELTVDSKCSIDELFKKVCARMDLKEFDIFGLAIKIRNEYHFVSNQDKLNKLINYSNNNYQSIKRPSLNPTMLFNSNTSNVDLLLNSTIHSINSSISSTTSSMLIPSNHPIYYQHPSYREFSSYLCNCSKTNNNNFDHQPTIQFYFRVKFYVQDPYVLSQPITRYLYYLQLRKNYLNFNIKLNDESYFMYASLALVADYGCFNSNIHHGNYFNVNSYFPKSIVNKYGENYIYENIVQLHIQQSRMTQKNAQIKFCIELSNDPNAFNFNLYNVFKNKEEMPGSICIGIGPKGILVFELRSIHEINLISTFLWQSVAKLNSEKKKFEIFINTGPKSRQIINYKYYTSCDKFSKYLLEMCRLTHAFSNNIFSRLADHRALANYVNESYSENVLLAFNNDEDSEPYQEREINDKLINDKQTPKSNKQIINVNEDENKINYIKNINKDQQEKKSNKKSSNEILSSCSFSSSSSSSYETPLSVNTNKSTSFINSNNNDFYMEQEGILNNENEMNSPESNTTSSTSPKILTKDTTSCSSDDNISHNYETVNEYNHYSNDSNDTYLNDKPSNKNYDNENYYQQNSLDFRQRFCSFLSWRNQEKFESYYKYSKIPIQPHSHSQTSLTTLQHSTEFLSIDSIKDHLNRTKSMLNSSSSTSQEQNHAIFMTPYKKNVRNPPSYEESLKKLKQSSTSSSSMSNDDTNKSLDNSNYENNKLFIIEDEIQPNNLRDINSKHLSVNIKANSRFIEDNEIMLSVESLEQIRKRAASMSLPMLTALCSDESLIRCLKQ